MSINPNIRQPAVAGLFYPGSKIDLDKELARFLESAPEIDIPGRIIGMVAPHAGYIYSGGVAARAYRQILDSEIDLVAVISPSHREYFTEISVFSGSECSARSMSCRGRPKTGDGGLRSEADAL